MDDVVEAQLLAIADTRKLLRQFEDKLLQTIQERNKIKNELESLEKSYDSLAADNMELRNALQIAKNIIEERLPQSDDMRPIFEALSDK